MPMTDTNENGKYYHYIVFGITYEDLITFFLNHDIPVFKHCYGVLVNDHYVAFQTDANKKQKFNSLDPKKWIQTTKTYEWYVNHGYKYNDVVIGHTVFESNKKCIMM